MLPSPTAEPMAAKRNAAREENTSRPGLVPVVPAVLVLMVLVSIGRGKMMKNLSVPFKVRGLIGWLHHIVYLVEM